MWQVAASPRPAVWSLAPSQAAVSVADPAQAATLHTNITLSISNQTHQDIHCRGVFRVFTSTLYILQVLYNIVDYRQGSPVCVSLGLVRHGCSDGRSVGSQLGSGNLEMEQRHWAGRGRQDTGHTISVGLVDTLLMMVHVCYVTCKVEPEINLY